MYRTLAEKEGVGRVVMCDQCNDLHVAMGHVTVTIPERAFIGLSEMIQQALQHPTLGLSQKVAGNSPVWSLFSRT